MNHCELHNKDKQWIYSIEIESNNPLIIKDGAKLQSRFECIECDKKVREDGRGDKREN